MNLFQVPREMVDKAWRDGASILGKACEKSGGEVTPDQLRLILTRGEKALIGVSEGQSVSGWAAVEVQQLPNLRALYVYAIHAPGATHLDLLREYAKANGCSVIRGACSDAVLRLWERKFKARKVYTIAEIDA